MNDNLATISRNLSWCKTYHGCSCFYTLQLKMLGKVKLIKHSYKVISHQHTNCQVWFTRGFLLCDQGVVFCHICTDCAAQQLL